MTFFVSVFKQVTPFLTLYQTDKPMVPFIAGDIGKLLKVLLQRFIKPGNLSLLSTPAQLASIDVDKKDIHLEYTKIDVGFRAETILKELIASKKIGDKVVMGFRLEAKQFLLTLVKKIILRLQLCTL